MRARVLRPWCTLIGAAVSLTDLPESCPSRPSAVGRDRESPDRAALDPTRIGIKRDDALVSLKADLDQNIGPEVTQRGRNLDA